MAQPITLRPAQYDTVVSAPSPQYADAIQSAFELLQVMHERGILNLLRGLIGAGSQAVDTVAQAMDTPDVIRTLRNFILLTKFFGNFPPEVLKSLVQTATDGAAQEKSRNAPGLLELYRKMTSADSRHALAVMLDLMQAVGKGL